MNAALHIGDKIVLPLSKIIGIFRYEKKENGFLEKAEASSGLRNKMENPRGFVLNMTEKGCRCYCTKISARKLIQRAQRFEEEIHGQER